ncbi:hypothetical protein Aperf_G00000064716 [Anoplocephala perfoliata]
MSEYEYEPWIDSIITGIKSRIINILRIWDDIGLEKQQLENRKNILKEHLDTLLETMIDEEEKSVSNLRKNITDLELKVLKLSDSLNIKGEPTDPNLPLIPRQRSLLATHKHLSTLLLSRIEHFKTLSAEHLRLCRRLGEPPKNFSYDSVPSAQLLETMDDEVNALLTKLVERCAETYKPKLSNQADELGDYTFLPSTNKGKGVGDNLNCRESKRALSSSDSMQKNTLEKSIKVSLTELYKLLDDCLVGSAVCGDYSSDYGKGSLNEAYFEQIECEIKRWQNYRIHHADAIAAFNSWRSSFVRLLEVEDQLHASKQQLTQAKGSSRLEAEATSLRKRILPDLEKNLFWAAQNSDDFRIYGLSPRTYVESAKKEAERYPVGTRRLVADKLFQLSNFSIESRSTSQQSLSKSSTPSKSDRLKKKLKSNTFVKSVVLEKSQSTTSTILIGAPAAYVKIGERSKSPCKSRLLQLGALSHDRRNPLKAEAPAKEQSSKSARPITKRRSISMFPITSTTKVPVLQHDSKADLSMLALWKRKDNEDSSLSQSECLISVKSDPVFAAPAGRAPRSRKKAVECKVRDPPWKWRTQLNPQAARVFKEKDPIPLFDLFLPHQSSDKENDLTLIPKIATSFNEGEMNTSISSASSLFTVDSNASLVSVTSGSGIPVACSTPSGIRAPRVIPSPRNRTFNTSSHHRRDGKLPQAVHILEEASSPVSVMQLFGSQASVEVEKKSSRR